MFTIYTQFKVQSLNRLGFLLSTLEDLRNTWGSGMFMTSGPVSAYYQKYRLLVCLAGAVANVTVCLTGFLVHGSGAVANVTDSGPLKPKGSKLNPRWRQGLS